MRKFIVKSSGKEIMFGDSISTESLIEKENEVRYSYYTSILSESNVQYFIDKGIIEEVDSKEKFVVNTDFNYYVKKVADKLGVSESTTVIVLERIANFNASVVFSMLLKEIALEIDNKYEDHISNSPEIFVVSFIDGAIVKVEGKDRIKNYKNFAAFRTFDDAKVACKILNPLLKRMYSKSGK